MARNLRPSRTRNEKGPAREAGPRREEMVGARGFEPPTPRSRTVCATMLRYAPRSAGDTIPAPFAANGWLTLRDRLRSGGGPAQSPCPVPAQSRTDEKNLPRPNTRASVSYTHLRAHETRHD